MTERTMLDQLNDVIELALSQQDASSAVAALSLKTAHLDDLLRNPAKREQSASAILDGIDAQISKPAITPGMLTNIHLDGCLTSNQANRAADFSFTAGAETATPLSRDEDGRLRTVGSFTTSDGFTYLEGVSIGAVEAFGAATHVMQVPGSDDGQDFKVSSSFMTTDGRPVWTLTKSGIRFNVEVANATYRPDASEAA